MPNYLHANGRLLVEEIMEAAIGENIIESPRDLQGYFQQCICEGELIPSDCKLIIQDETDDGYFVVFKWKDRYYRVDHDEYSYEDNVRVSMFEIYEVIPYTRTVTDYISIK